MIMKKSFLISLVLPALFFLSLSLSAAGKEEVIASRNFPFTWSLSQDEAVLKLVRADIALMKLARDKYAALEAAPDGTKAIECYSMSEEETKVSAERLSLLAGRAPMKALVKALRASGQYCLIDSLPDYRFIQEAWKMDVAGMNRIFRIYALGEKPRYAQIDSIDFDMTDTREITRVRSDVRTNLLYLTRGEPFYAIPLRAALTWLDVNGRDEAADFIPLDQTINRTVYAVIPEIRWEDYPYSLILILGAGVHRPYETISPRSRLRARYAAELWRQGKAPFLAVSGGRVWPFKTVNTEALQIKKYLVETCGVPENVIISDPHARHTTTNLRNISRIMLDRGIPMDKPCLITTSTHQINYVTDKRFIKASIRDLGYVPFRIGKRLNDREVEFYPAYNATQVTSLDPLDP